jgi:hypothetical protein
MTMPGGPEEKNGGRSSDYAAINAFVIHLVAAADKVKSDRHGYMDDGFGLL